MREIKYIAVHCTGGSQRATVNDLMAEFRKKGWKNPGYHYVVTADGQAHMLLGEDKSSNGVRGYNSVTVNVAWTGGVDTASRKLPPIDNRTEEQRRTLRSLLRILHHRHPGAEILGHRDFPGVKKACPCFDAREEYKDI